MRDRSLLLVALAALACSLLTQGQADSASDLQRAFEGILGDGARGDIAVTGSVEMHTETNFSFAVTTNLLRGEGASAYGLSTTFSITDDRCDFRDVDVTTRIVATLPSTVETVSSAVCSLLGLLCDVSRNVEVARYTRSYNLIPDGSNTVQTDIVVDLVEQVRTSSPTAAASLDLLGADATFTVKNLNFMVTGMSFDLYFKADVLDSDAQICTRTGTVYDSFRSAARSIDSTFCTAQGGIYIGEDAATPDGINLGSELKAWISSSGQNSAYIDANGKISVGAEGAHCTVLPSHFSIHGRVDDLSNIPTDQTQLRNALADAVNRYLPSGYQISADQFSNLNITIDQSTGDMTIQGNVYSGAGKSPAGILDALRRFIADGGSLTTNAADGSSTGTIVISGGDLDGDSSCASDSALAAAGACDSNSAPPTSGVAGEVDPDSSDESNDKDRASGEGNMLMVIIGTAMITLAVVAVIAGAVVGIKYIRKRRATVSGLGRVGRFAPDNDHVQLRDNFDAVVANPAISGGTEAVVWGDVVSVDKA